MIRARFRGPVPHLVIPPPPPSEDDARAHALCSVLGQLGVRTQAYCRKCGTTQPFAGVSDGGLCFAHALAEQASRVSDDDCVCWDPTVERLANDTEPLLSSGRDTRDTEPCEAP